MTPPKISSETDLAISAAMIETRNLFPLQFALGGLQPKSDTHWEEITCLGYSPEMHRLEAIVNVKQSSGYAGPLCSNASKEYVRFYVDFKDSGGFRDMGLASFKSVDISDAPPGLQHPLSYMLYLYISDEQYRRFTDCSHAIIPTMRAILSWNVPPPLNTPNYPPHYGNVRDANILLERRSFVFLGDIVELTKELKLKNVFAPDLKIALPALQTPNVKDLHEANKKAGIPDHRTFFATIGAAIPSPMNFSKAVSLFNMSDLVTLNIDPAKLAGLFNSLPNEQKADIAFEEVTCVGLNTDTDTLGAVVHIKKSSGYSGDLCHKGSMEHVAFWADWDNNGTFDQYLGTASFQTHDIANIPAGGMFYNVALPFDVSKRLKPCQTPNLLRVRAVLSWESLPSTTNPNQLNTWGNSIDALVQLRPGRSSGLHTIISLVGNVDRSLIDSAQHLYSYNGVAPTMNNNRPWGGNVNFCGIIDRNGFNGLIKYRLRYKPFGAPDTAFQPVSHNESFGRWAPPAAPDPHVAQTADADGWYVYDVNPALGIYDIFDNGLLANLQTSGLTDGTYTIRFEFTDELGNPQTGDEFSIVLCNRGMSVSPTANAAVDTTKDLDLVIDGGDCHSYTNADSMISGHLRAIHPYFALWALDLQPTSHTHGILPSPQTKDYSASYAGASNDSWTLETLKLDPCGYTVSLAARTRVILDSSPGNFPYYGPKAVGFAKQP